MKVNVAVPAVKIYTHEGGRAVKINDEAQLRRSVMSHMLFEGEFYEDGTKIADRIAALVPKLKFETVAQIAIDARTKSKLRHVPLFIAKECLKHFKGRKVGDMIMQVIQRPDEISELLALYWKDGKRPLAKQLKLGLARALNKFDEYELKKWDGGNAAIKLRDVLFLVHARPQNAKIAHIFAKLANKTHIPAKIVEQYGFEPNVVGLASAETWENRLSRGENKRAVFEEMIREGKLGALAMLRNMRNMLESGVPDDVIREGLRNIKVERVLPFRFISAAKYAPRFEPELEAAMLKCIEGMSKIPGETLLVIDVSGSMSSTVSSRSELTRFEAACGLAMLARELCETVRVVTFSDRVVEVVPRRGFALRDLILKSQPHSGTQLGAAVQVANSIAKPEGRMIVFTDEQTAGRVPEPKMTAYMVNVASAQNGVGYGKWMHVDGWSEATLAFISELEKAE